MAAGEHHHRRQRGVGDVEASRQAGVDAQLGAVSVPEYEIGAEAPRSSTGHCPVRSPVRVSIPAANGPGRGERCDRDFGGGRELPPPGVIDCHHGGAGAFGREQPGFGLEVLVHGPVQVQVVLGQVREPGDVEHHGVHAVEGHGVRGNLHGGGIEPAFAHERQQRVHIRGFGGGEQARDRLAACQDLNRPDQPGPFAQRPQERIDEVSGGGLAVGACHAEEGRGAGTVGPALVNACGQPADHAARLVSQQHRDGDVIGQCQHARSGAVCQDRHRTGFDGLGHEVSPVPCAARQGHVEVSRADRPGVQGDPGDRDGTGCPGNGDANLLADGCQRHCGNRSGPEARGGVMAGRRGSIGVGEL